MKLSSEDRLDLMKRMRAEGLRDASIGRILNISRQRVEQLLGARNDPNPQENPETVALVTQLYCDGFKGREIAEAVSNTESVVSRIVRFLPDKIKHEARKNRLEIRTRRRLADFFNGRESARSVDLMRYDQYLYNSSRFKPFSKWCEEFGVKYEYRVRYGENND